MAKSPDRAVSSQAMEIVLTMSKNPMVCKATLLQPEIMQGLGNVLRNFRNQDADMCRMMCIIKNMSGSPEGRLRIIRTEGLLQAVLTAYRVETNLAAMESNRNLFAILSAVSGVPDGCAKIASEHWLCGFNEMIKAYFPSTEGRTQETEEVQRALLTLYVNLSGIKSGRAVIRTSYVLDEVVLKSAVDSATCPHLAAQIVLRMTDPDGKAERVFEVPGVDVLTWIEKNFNSGNGLLVKDMTAILRNLSRTLERELCNHSAPISLDNRFYMRPRYHYTVFEKLVKLVCSDTTDPKLKHICKHLLKLLLQFNRDVDCGATFKRDIEILNANKNWSKGNGRRMVVAMREKFKTARADEWSGDRYTPATHFYPPNTAASWHA